MNLAWTSARTSDDDTRKRMSVERAAATVPSSSFMQSVCMKARQARLPVGRLYTSTRPSSSVRTKF
ncbi:hypothetical protein F5B21DRAFT_488282 [Xylaria acuta]|nr:hypothetical protein F5B21DRAFT_488282 [Xylaria acuta]